MKQLKWVLRDEAKKISVFQMSDLPVGVRRYQNNQRAQEALAVGLAALDKGAHPGYTVAEKSTSEYFAAVRDDDLKQVGWMPWEDDAAFQRRMQEDQLLRDAQSPKATKMAVEDSERWSEMVRAMAKSAPVK